MGLNRRHSGVTVGHPMSQESDFGRRSCLRRSGGQESKTMLGIDDKYVAAAYLLCILSTILCVVYGILNWNRGAEEPKPEDLQWAREEKKVEEEL